MVLDRLTPVQELVVFNPRWHDRKALLADFKLGVHNKIVFPKANSLPGEYYISGSKAKSFPLEPMKTKSGGTIQLRAVPLDELEPLERK